MSIEGQNFSSIENQPLNNEIQNKTPDNLEKISAFFESHDFDTSYLQNSYEAFSPEQKNIILQAYQEIQKNPDLLMEIMELPYDEDSFLIFKESLELYISFDEYEEVLSGLDTKKNQLNIKEENEDIKEENEDIKEENEDIKEESIKTGQEDIQEKSENTVQKNIEELIEKNNLEKSRKIISGLINDYPKFFDGKLSIESSDEDIKSFFGNANKVEEFLNNIRKNNPEEFENVYRKLENVQKLGAFEIAGLKPLEEYKNASEIPKIPGGIEIVKYGLDTSQFHVSRVEGDSLIYGDQKIDFGENPPVKYIKNGNFELKSGELDYKVDKQLRSDIFVLEHKIPQIDEKISSLENQKLQSMDYSVNMQKVTNFNQETLDFLFEQTLKDENNPLKNEIKNAIEAVGRDNNSQNTEKLKSLLIENSKRKEHEINILLTELNSQKNLAELKLDTMKDKLDAMRDAFKQKVLEKDEKVRDVLQFVNQIGLDLINPQSRLDQLFTELQQNSLKIPGLSLDPKKIDLANGRFGESDMEQSTDKWKENLIKFFNKMVSGNTDEPNNPKDFISVGGKTINPTKMKESLENAGVLNDMGEAQIDAIRKNLQSTKKSEKSTNSQEK